MLDRDVCTFYKDGKHGYNGDLPCVCGKLSTHYLNRIRARIKSDRENIEYRDLMRRDADIRQVSAEMFFYEATKMLLKYVDGEKA